MITAQEIELMLSSVRCPDIDIRQLTENDIQAVNWKSIVKNLMLYVDLLNSEFSYMLMEDDYENHFGINLLLRMAKVVDMDFSEDYPKLWIDVYNRAEACSNWITNIRTIYPKEAELYQSEMGLCKKAFEDISTNCLDLYRQVWNAVASLSNTRKIGENSITEKKDVDSNDDYDEDNGTSEQVEANENNSQSTDGDNEQPPTYEDLELSCQFGMTIDTMKSFIDFCRKHQKTRDCVFEYNRLVKENLATSGKYINLTRLHSILERNNAIKCSYSNFTKFTWE